MNIKRFTSLSIIASLVLLLASPLITSSQTTKFNYQGKLNEGGTVATGTYSMKFSLYDADTAGTQIGSTITENSVTVTNGIFSVVLDFGSNSFPGAARYLEIQVKKASDVSYITLSPRQEILASPYSVKTLSAAFADSLSSACVGCVTDSHINDVAGSKVTGSVSSADTLSATLPISKGGTGSTTKPFVDLSDNQTIAGDKEFTGTTKFSGDVQFAGKINTFKSMSASIYSTIVPSTSYSWVALPIIISVNGSQTIAASATAGLGTNYISRTNDVAICYSSGGALSSLSGSFQSVYFQTGQVTATTLTATNGTLPQGDYLLGFCIKSNQFSIMDYNNQLSGWVMIFQN